MLQQHVCGLYYFGIESITKCSCIFLASNLEYYNKSMKYGCA